MLKFVKNFQGYCEKYLKYLNVSHSNLSYADIHTYVLGLIVLTWSTCTNIQFFSPSACMLSMYLIMYLIIPQISKPKFWNLWQLALEWASLIGQMQGNVGFEYRSQDLDNLHFYQTSPVLTVWIFCFLQTFSFFSLRKTKVGILFGYLTAVTLLSTQLTSSSPSSSSAPLKTPSYPRSHEPLFSPWAISLWPQQALTTT